MGDPGRQNGRRSGDEGRELQTAASADHPAAARHTAARRLVERADRRRRREPLGPAVACTNIQDIIRVYEVPVRRFVERAHVGADTDDVVQEVLMDLHVSLAGTEKTAEEIRDLVFTIALHKVVDCARAQKRDRSRRDDDATADDAPTSRPSLDLEVDLARIARAALAKLSREQQELLRLGVGDDDEHGALAKAAAAMGITAVALRSRFKRARKAFRDAVESILGEHLEDDATDSPETPGPPESPEPEPPTSPDPPEPAAPHRRRKSSSA